MRLRALLAALMLALAFLPAAPAQASTLTLQQLVAKLKVASEKQSGSYQRSYFKLWIDANRNGCDTRKEVLIAESKTKVVRGSNCKIVSGLWVSKYDGERFTSPSGIDIDHVVPLHEAWESGAYAWTAGQRQAYANDLGWARSLRAVSASSNRAKSDQDPAEWMPTLTSFACEYLADWVTVKYRWRLTVDRAELNAIKSRGSCMNLVVTLPARMAVGGGGIPASSPTPKPSGKLDPQFATCTDAKAAGYGPYTKGVDPEYAWYTDRDQDGIVCE